MVSFNQLMIVSGILAAYIVNFALKGIGDDNWRWMLGLGAVPGAALAIGMAFMPYSPRWLAERGRDDEAERPARTHRDDEVDEELKEIKEIAQREGSIRDLFGSAVRPMLIVGLGLAIFQQIVGINTIIYYAPTILSFSGTSNIGAIGQTVFIGVTNVIFTVIAILLLDRLGPAGVPADRDSRTDRCIGRLRRVLLLGHVAGRRPVAVAGRAGRLHRLLRHGTRPGVLADDLRDLPAGAARPGHGALHRRQLVVQLHRLRTPSSPWSAISARPARSGCMPWSA